MGNAHAGIVEPFDRQGECSGDRVVQPVERQSLGDAEAQAGERNWLERQNIFAGHYGVGRGAIGNALADRAYGIERGAQRKRAVGRHALPARLEADEAAQRRRNAHRAAGIGADRELAHAICNADWRPGRGTSGHAGAVARIARRAEMRIGADTGERELGHVGLGDNYGARRTQPLHDRRVGFSRRRLLGENL